MSICDGGSGAGGGALALAVGRRLGLGGGGGSGVYSGVRSRGSSFSRLTTWTFDLCLEPLGMHLLRLRGSSVTSSCTFSITSSTTSSTS